MRSVSLICLATLCAASCGGEGGTPYVWQLPQGFPEPFVPADNPMTVENVELGRHLFYETRLSGNQTQACATCHTPETAFSDGKLTPMGSTGDQLARNSMSLTNVVYNQTYTWANPVLDAIEKQVLVPMFGEHPVELGMTGHESEILDRLRGDPSYHALFSAAFANGGDPFTNGHLVESLASFVRTLVSGGSAYDRFFYQDEPLSPEAMQGFELFFSERCECYHCHAGINFTSSFRSKRSPAMEGDNFQNTGLYNIGGTGDFPPGNRGLYEVTNDANDIGKFRVPTLRNVELTAPYMHDGSIATLEAVIEHYAAGGRTITSGPYAGVGKDNPNKNPLVRGFSATPEEKAALVAFLRSLTDITFTNDPRFQNPFQ